MRVAPSPLFMNAPESQLVTSLLHISCHLPHGGTEATPATTELAKALADLEVLEARKSRHARNTQEAQGQGKLPGVILLVSASLCGTPSNEIPSQMRDALDI